MSLRGEIGLGGGTIQQNKVLICKFRFTSPIQLFFLFMDPCNDRVHAIVPGGSHGFSFPLERNTGLDI